jgi:predicted oxidoreductase
LGAIETGPFYGGKLTVAVVESLGGLRINVDGQVLDPYDAPIPRLYGAGAVTATLRGYPGSGASITRGLVMGRVTGKKAAAEKS